MVATKDILQGISVLYEGIELNKFKALKEYSEYLCEIIDSEDKHTAAISLHTGSVYYQLMAIALAALGCLFYRNTDTTELVESLSPGDLLIIDGQRVRFQGVKTGAQLGINLRQWAGVEYFTWEYNQGRQYIPLEQAKQKNIVLYQGTSENLGGQGIKAKEPLKPRKDFLTTFLKDKVVGDISSEINHSIAIVLDRNTAERFYRGIYFTYNNTKVALSDLVTAAYYSEDDCYQIGNNPTKEEPIIKFYSKISTCREAIIDNKQKRIIGCVIGDEHLWVSNSETHDISDRKGLKFVLLSGKTDYTRYINWYESDEYKFYAQVPEIVEDFLDDEAKSLSKRPFQKELSLFARRCIEEQVLYCNSDRNDLYAVKKKILRIKRECFDSEGKENFIISSWFLLNLCRSAFFPLSYCDKAFNRKLISWTIKEKLDHIRNYCNTLAGENRGDADFVYAIIEKIVKSLYDSNPKGELIKERMMKGKVDCIVATKAYYEALFLLWLEECNVTVRPKVVTISAFEKSIGFNRAIFTTGYYDFEFNPYGDFGYGMAELLLYDYEKSQVGLLKKRAAKGRKLIHDKNAKKYVSEEATDEYEELAGQTEDIQFETELGKMAQDLLLKEAYHNIALSSGKGDGTAKIDKVITFASGCVGYFTKYYKAYKINGSEVVEVELDELRIGDSIVFTKQSENKDIVDLLLTQLIVEQYKNTKYPEYYRFSVQWKEKLREYMYINLLTYQELIERLRHVGCTKHYATVRSWLVEESHIVGPRDLGDYEAISRLVQLEESPADIKKSCDEIRSLRMRILDLLGKAIIRGMFTDNKDRLSELVYEKAENLTQIEQITSINDSVAEVRLPVYLINKPCDI